MTTTRSAPMTDARLYEFASPAWVESVAKVPADEYATMVAEDPSVLGALLGALRHARAELTRIKPIFDLVCKLQDADQCEGHSTGDECDQGEIEHQLFQALVLARDEDPERSDKLERGRKKRGAATASDQEHVLNAHDECVSWCPACKENTSRGLNPDGTVKAAPEPEASRG